MVDDTTNEDGIHKTDDATHSIVWVLRVIAGAICFVGLFVIVAQTIAPVIVEAFIH